MFLIEGGFCSGDRYDVHAVKVTAIPIFYLLHDLRVGAMGGEKRPDYDRDLPVLPSDKNEYVVAGYAPILERGLETHFILEVDAHVDREAEPYRGWLYRREWPNVVVKRATILLWMRRIGGEDGGWPTKGLSNDRRQC